MEALLKQANVLKGEGNVAFAGGDASTAMSKYSDALSMLTKDHHDAAAVETAAREEWSSVVAALNNNLSNLCLVSEEWSKAEQHARAALNVVGGQPGALKALEDKARFRLATALYHLGRRFEAFIHMLRVSPATLDPALRRSITKAVGIASLDDAFTLQDHHAGGITAVARSDVAAGSDLFVEGQLVLSFDAAMADESTATTESRCYTFAKELLAMYMDDKRQHQFQRAERELSGSWPRHIDDVDPTVRCSVEVALVDLFNGAVEDPRVREHITLLALQCRYNCFHRGFFRASALVNHGCNPNAAMKYTPGRSVTLHADLPDDAFAGCIGVVALRACRDIKPGDIISVKYLGDFDFIIGVLPRREMLRSSWLFTCECDRCTADLEEGAVTEWVRCTATPGCAGFVHLPAPPCFRSDSTLEVSVPAGVRERQCRVCGQKQHLCPRTQDGIHSVRVASVSMMTSDAAMTLKQRHEACVALRKQVVDLVHDSHWAHTTVLYVFCFRTQRRVEEIFDLFGNGKLAASVVAFELGLDNFDAKSPSAAAGPLRDELDVLGWYLELQIRLQPFYPDDQLWALHMAIIRCAVVLACATPDRFIEVEPLIVTRVTHLNRNTAALIAALLQKHVKNAKALKSVLRALK